MTHAMTTLAPNPAHARVVVHLPPKPYATQTTLSFYDGLGRIVQARTVAQPAAGCQVEMSLHGFAPGLYRLLVQSGGQRTLHTLAVD